MKRSLTEASMYLFIICAIIDDYLSGAIDLYNIESYHHFYTNTIDDLHRYAYIVNIHRDLLYFHMYED